MKTPLPASLLTLGFLLFACAQATPPLPSATPPPTPSPSPVPFPFPTATLSLDSTPPDLSTLKTYSSDKLGLRFDYPAIWFLDTAPEQPVDILLTSFDPASPPHKLDWNENTVTVSFREVPADQAPDTLDGYLHEWGGHAEASGMTVFKQEQITIGKGISAAHLVVVSGSGGTFEFVYFILAPHHFEVGVEGNFALAKRVLDTVRSCGPC